MTPTIPSDYHAPDVEVLDPSADDPENWWLDLGCVEFPELLPV